MCLHAFWRQLKYYLYLIFFRNPLFRNIKVLHWKMKTIPCIKNYSWVFLENRLSYRTTFCITHAIYHNNVRVKQGSLFQGIYFGLCRNTNILFQFCLFFLHLRDKMHNDKIGVVRTLFVKDHCKSCIYDR